MPTLGNNLAFWLYVYKSGAAYDPSPSPTILDARLPDGTAFPGTPAFTHVATGIFKYQLNASSVTQTGTYLVVPYSSDSSVQLNPIMVDVDDPMLNLDTSTGYTGGTLGADIAATFGKVMTFGGQTITLSTMQLKDGDPLPIVAGDSYIAADGNAPQWTVTGIPSLVGATITFKARSASTGVEQSVVGVVVDATHCYVDLTGTFTSGLTSGRYSVDVLYPNGSRITFAVHGELIVSTQN
jgi:hypothetical protein